MQKYIYVIVIFLSICSGCRETAPELEVKITNLKTSKTQLSKEIDLLSIQKQELENRISFLKQDERVLKAIANNRPVKYIVSLYAYYYKGKLDIISTGKGYLDIEVSKEFYDSLEKGKRLKHTDGWYGAFLFEVSDKKIITE